jgi:hypothetical protein
MTLTMRPTGLGSGIDKDRPDYAVVTGEWEVGRIYEMRGGSRICAGSGRLEGVGESGGAARRLGDTDNS